MPASILPTRNDAWGFYGACAEFTDPDHAWAHAMPAITCATTGDAEAVREFLDSRHGRHFADDVRNGIESGRDLETAIAAAVTHWMGWTISRNTARDAGIPQGLPYLTGFVAHCAIMSELA